MATTTYKRMDVDALIFFTSYILTKLKSSPIAENTTYTIERSSDSKSFTLKDNLGTTISTISGLMTDAERTKLGLNLATEEYVAQQIAAVPHLKFQKVQTLPDVATASTDVIYLVPITDTADNAYMEWYVDVSGSTRKWEQLGSTSVDLSGYVQASQMVAITNAEITTIVDDAYSNVFS